MNSGSCRYIPVTATTNAAWDYQEIDVEVDVWRGGSYLGTADLERVGKSSRLSGSYFYCPNIDDVGSFRLGDSQVSWERYDDDYTYYYDGDFTDSSRGSMVVKQAAGVALSATNKGKTRKFRATASYFGIERWYRFPKGQRLFLQRQASASGAWQTIKSAKTKRKGLAKFKVKTASTFRYRVVSQATSRTFASASRVVTK